MKIVWSGTPVVFLLAILCCVGRVVQEESYNTAWIETKGEMFWPWRQPKGEERGETVFSCAENKKRMDFCHGRRPRTNIHDTPKIYGIRQAVCRSLGEYQSQDMNYTRLFTFRFKQTLPRQQSLMEPCCGSGAPHLLSRQTQGNQSRVLRHQC